MSQTAAPLPRVRITGKAATVGLLLVEDETPTRQEFATILREVGFTVRVARNGLEAIRLAKARTPDIVLLDLMMRGLPGLEAGREIQAACPDTAIIVLSQFIDDESRAKAANLGLEVMEWLDKPITELKLKQLVAAIKRAVERLEKRRRFRELLESEEARGLGAERLLRLVRRWEPEIPDPVVADLTREAGDESVKVINGLRASLSSMRSRGEQGDIQERQLCFGPIKLAILGADFWQLFKQADTNRRRVAMQLRLAIHKLSSLDLEERHLVALDFVLTRLAQTQVVSAEDVKDSERILRYQGIETLLDLGAQRGRLLKIYKEEAD